jgi:hypothetical protein
MAEYPAQLKKGGQSAGLEATGELAEMLARVLLLYAKVLFFKANARTAAFDYANAVGHGCLISAGCHILPARRPAVQAVLSNPAAHRRLQGRRPARSGFRR